MKRLILLSLEDDELFWLRLLLLRGDRIEARIPKETLDCLLRQLDRSARARIPAQGYDGVSLPAAPERPAGPLEAGTLDSWI